ncbi:MAG: hypothetical protein IKR88_00515 [Bacteroidales bacterium]|nr:hypothetical protein [Bacteroidales bacterium]
MFYYHYFYRNGGMDFIHDAETNTSRSVSQFTIDRTNDDFVISEYTNPVYPHFTYVAFEPGKVSCAKVGSNYQICLSSKFTGCAMAYFVHKVYGAFVAHISLGATGDTRDAWNDFIRREKNNITTYRIFKPLRHNSGICQTFEGLFRNNIPTSCIGMITLDAECFSILVTDTKTASFEANSPIMSEKIRPTFYHGSNYFYLETSIKRFEIPPNVGSIEW